MLFKLVGSPGFKKYEQQLFIVHHPPLKMYFRGERSGKINTFIVVLQNWFPRTPPKKNTFFDEGCLKKMRSMGRDIHAPQDLLFYVGAGSIHFGGWFFQDPPGIPGNVQFFSGECLFTALIKRKYVRGVGYTKSTLFLANGFYTSC